MKIQRRDLIAVANLRDTVVIRKILRRIDH